MPDNDDLTIDDPTTSDAPAGLRDYAKRKETEAEQAIARAEAAERQLEWAKAGIDLDSEDAKALISSGVPLETAKRLLAAPAAPPAPVEDEIAAHGEIAAGTAGTAATTPEDKTLSQRLVDDANAQFQRNGHGLSPNELADWMRANGVEPSDAGVYLTNQQRRGNALSMD